MAALAIKVVAPLPIINTTITPVPSSPTTQSPITPSNKTSASDKEKRKRSRVTPEQLVHLERFFFVDRSPTAARRKEISELLGMHERQTQIWFQNRRAKAKLQDGKARAGSTETLPETPPELSTGFGLELYSLIHEDEPVTIIPCTDLSIGTWRRVATSMGKHDLVAYVSDTKRCLTWFIHSAGFGFKMEIPFNIILKTEFANAAPGTGLASFVLSQPPIFYLECVPPSLHSDGSIFREWKRCADWTEGHQASKVLRHDLIGSATQLTHLLRNLHDYTSCAGLDFQLTPHNTNHEPLYNPIEHPMTDINRQVGYASNWLPAFLPESNMPCRKRSYLGPVLSHTSPSGISPISPTSPSVPYPMFSFLPYL